jgi:ubiquinone/menaquinone biosynthesis C-methylase UbiE
MSDTPALPAIRSIDDVYGDAFDDQEVEAVLDESLSPRDLNQLLFDLVADTGLPPGSTVLDIGAREGRYSFELARRFGFSVRGVEPVRRHLDNAARDLAALSVEEPEAATRVRIEEGVAEKLTDPSGSVDLIWCRDVLVHIENLETAFGEFRRVLKPGGRALVFQMTATDWLSPAESAFMWPPAGIHAASLDPQRFEAAITTAGLSIAQCIQLHGETRERLEEDGVAASSKQLLRVSRMLRNRAAYEERFGTIAYEFMLTDCLWGVYQMIGKLNPRIYVLSA